MRLRWIGHVQRRDSGFIGVLKMELPARRKRGSPQRRFIDVMIEDGVTEEDVSKSDMQESTIANINNILHCSNL